MKRELKSYLAGWLALYLAAVCLPFLLAGCASDSAAPWPVDGETTSVTLRMSVAGTVGTLHRRYRRMSTPRWKTG